LVQADAAMTPDRIRRPRGISDLPHGMWLALRRCVFGLLQLVGDTCDATGARLVAAQHLIADIEARLRAAGVDGRAGLLAAERRLHAVVDGVDAAVLASWQTEIAAAHARLERFAAHLETLDRLKRQKGPA